MKTRIANDFYPTPDKLIKAYLNHSNRPHIDLDAKICEPCKGDGAILNPLVEYGFKNAFGSDITMGADYDATESTYWSCNYPDWVISNPPFRVATPIIRWALSRAKCGVIMILRSSYIEPCMERRDVLNDHISHITVCNPRPKFRADTKGSDSATVAFFCWSKRMFGKYR